MLVTEKCSVLCPQLVSPVKKVAVHGQVESTEPCVIKLINTYDDDDVIQSVLNIDPDRRSIKFSTNYDLGNVDCLFVPS